MVNVFIADDDIDDQMLFESTLNQVNPDAMITAVDNGKDLLSTLEDKTPPQPDVIFLDLNMPKMNGFDALGELRSRERFKNVPIIIYTTSDNKDDIERSQKMGADYFITKPLDYSKLVDVLDKAVKKVNGGFTKSSTDEFVIR